MTDRRRRRAASPDSPRSTSRADNPFAPPPEDRPDQPWQPRHRTGGDSDGTDGTSSPDGNDGRNGSGGSHDSGKKTWGSQWSSRQPGRQSGGFGRPRGSGDDGGDGPGSGGPGRGLRWDPADPVQRRARYALHCGIWGFFFALFSLPPVGLLLGALALYWGITSLREKNRVAAGTGPGEAGAKATAADISGGPDARPRKEASEEARPAVSPAQAAKAQATAAIGGLVTGALALVVVAATFSFQMVYEDYFTCDRDALTQSSREDCKQHLPEEIRPFMEAPEG